MQRARCSPRRWLALLLFVAIAVIPATQAYTDPNNYNLLVAFRDSMKVRSPNWAAALALWTCPTPPANTRPAGTCDPCGEGSDGNWYHMHCRGNTRGWGESGDGTKNGLTTNMHITSSLVDGPVPKELCIIPTLREHDFGGQLNRGHLTGPIPRWLARCFPKLEELDLSNNRLTGTLPPYLATLPVISEIKFENNGIIGTIPSELGSIKRLRRFQAEFNNMHGPIPKSFENVAPYLTQFHIARNDFEGDLSMLVKGHLTTVTVHDNPKLCGMVPATVRFAKGYNPGGTGLGRPCGSATGAPAAPTTAAAASTAPASGSGGDGGGSQTGGTQPAASAGQTGTGSSSTGSEGSAGSAASPSPAAAEAASSPAPDSAGEASQPPASTESSAQPSSPSPSPSGGSSGSSGGGDTGGDTVGGEGGTTTGGSGSGTGLLARLADVIG